MINVSALKGEIAKAGYSQRGAAKKLGIGEQTFYRKMKKGVFDSDEIMEMAKLLDIKDLNPIFFTDNVT